MSSSGSLNERVWRLSAQLVRMHARARSGHLGGDLSCLPGLVAVADQLVPDDLLVLSKGHSAAALYVTLAEMGKITAESLETYYQDGTSLPGHPPTHAVEAIPFATGSLGHGFPLAAGAALARQISGRPGTVFVMTSDGEWEEGSTWEALIFATHHRLTNLVVLIDLNGWQALGSTSEVASLDQLAQRLSGFPADVVELNGDDADTIAEQLTVRREKLTVLVLHTTKGRGLDALENTLASHYAVLRGDEAAAAAASMEGRP